MPTYGETNLIFRNLIQTCFAETPLQTLQKTSMFIAGFFLRGKLFSVVYKHVKVKTKRTELAQHPTNDQGLTKN